MTYNPYLLVPFIAWLVSQVIKFVRRAISGQINFRLFYASGGMPSAHTATVCALATTALVREGFNSPIFGLAGIFAAVVIYDSFGVRRNSGDQAVAINAILRNLKTDEKSLTGIKLREVLGHTPAEVIVGAFVGVAVALLIN